MRTIWKKMKDTKQQFEHVIALCRDLFSKKLHDYGPAWRILRPASVTDQIFIKANRIRSIETKGVTLVNEGIRSEFIAIVNYGIIGLIQLELATPNLPTSAMRRLWLYMTSMQRKRWS